VFFFPHALFGAISLAALAGIYIYRSRLRRKPVPSLMLWRRTTLPREGGIRRDVLRLPPLFFLELAALASLVLAAAAPLVRRDNPFPLNIYISDSPSMYAVGSDGRNPLQRAEPVITSAARKRPVHRVTTPLPPSLRHDEDALIISDRLPPPGYDRPPIAEWRAVGEALPNSAITFASRSPNPDGTESVLVEVRAFCSGDAVRRLTITTTPDIFTHDIPLDSAGRGTLRLTLPPDTPSFTVRIPADALASDNTAPLPASTSRKITASVSITDAPLNRAVINALDATGAVILSDAKPDILIHDATSFAIHNSQFTINFHAPLAARWSRGPYLSTSSPFLDGVSFEGVAWETGTNSLPGRPVVFAGNTPVIASERDALHFLASHASSPFFRSASWPALVYNIIDSRVTAKHGPLPVHRSDPAVSDLRDCTKQTPNPSISQFHNFTTSQFSLAWLAGLLALALLTAHHFVITRQT